MTASLIAWRDRGEAAARRGGRLPVTTLLLIVLLAAGCSPGNSDAPTVQVDFSQRSDHAATPAPITARTRLDFAVAGMMSPVATLNYYRDLLDYLESSLGLKLELRQRKTYQEINEMLLNGELDAAFLGSGGYVRGGQALAGQILAVPVVAGQSTCQAYIVVRADSGIRDFAGLRHRSFAFTDALSATGWLYPVFLLRENGEFPNSYFSRTIYTYGHDRSLKALAQGLIDGASVSSVVFDFIAKWKPDDVAALRIIQRSPPLAVPPVVGSPNLQPELKQRLADALLGMSRDAAGRRILNRLGIDRFAVGRSVDYDEVRRMVRAVGPWPARGQRGQ